MARPRLRYVSNYLGVNVTIGLVSSPLRGHLPQLAAEAGLAAVYRDERRKERFREWLVEASCAIDWRSAEEQVVDMLGEVPPWE